MRALTKVIITLLTAIHRFVAATHVSRVSPDGGVAVAIRNTSIRDVFFAQLADVPVVASNGSTRPKRSFAARGTKSDSGRKRNDRFRRSGLKERTCHREVGVRRTWPASAPASVVATCGTMAAPGTRPTLADPAGHWPEWSCSEICSPRSPRLNQASAPAG